MYTDTFFRKKNYFIPDIFDKVLCQLSQPLISKVKFFLSKMQIV